MTALVVVFLVLAIFTLMAIIRGFVLSYLWGWFVVPFGLPELSIPHAIGISLIIGFLTHQIRKEDEKKQPDEVIGSIGTAIIATGFAFLVGWIVSLFM